MDQNQRIEAAARAAHEANRAWCIALGDMSQQPWKDAPDWQRVSALKGVRCIVDDPSTTPEKLHESWLADKEADGWKFGPVKDPERKEHPCFVPYDQLPAAQRAKDHIFNAVVRAVLAAAAES
jgi:hypothetical protein